MYIYIYIYICIYIYTYKGFHSTFAALLSYSGVVVRVRAPLLATQTRAPENQSRKR